MEIRVSVRERPLGTLVIADYGGPAESAFLACADPLPVGTPLQLHADGGTISATVTRIREAVSGRDDAPGMFIRASVPAEQRYWWQALGGRKSVEDDGRRTDVMDAVTPPAEPARSSRRTKRKQ